MALLSAQPATVEQIDRELKLRVQRRQSHTREISRISQLVIAETKEIDRLLAERSAATMPKVPDTPEGVAELPPLAKA